MRFFIFLLLVLLLSACKDGANGKNKVHKPANKDIKYAQHFRILYDGDARSLEIYDPENGKPECIYLQKDEKPKVISLSATTTGMLAILGRQDQIVGVSSFSTVHDSILQTRILNGKVRQYGDEANYSIEAIVKSGAKLILYNGYGDDFPNADKLKSFGIQTIPLYDWRESHPLAKAEWIKLIAFICGGEKEAAAYFDQVDQSYQAVKELVPAGNNGPTVLSGNLIGDQWYAPYGDSFAGNIIRDAGGRYRYADTKGTGSLALSIEQILIDNKNTDIWINPGYSKKNELLKINPHAQFLPSLDNAYCYSSSQNKYWELSAAEPHYILEDLIHLFYPDLDSSYQFHYYRPVD